LKPDACRRVEGRLNRLLAIAPSFWLNQNQGAKPKAGSPLSRSKGGVAHLVRSFRLMPE